MKKSERLLKIVYLPNVRQREKRAAYRPGEAPDLFFFEKEEANCNIRRIERDLHAFPWNPLASKGAFYAGFDLFRALKVLLLDRDADVVVSVFESNAFFVLLLARLFFFRPKVVLWEVSSRGWRIRDWVVNYVAERADRVFVLTKGQKSAIEARCDLKAPADVVGFFVDEHFFSPRPRAQSGQPYLLAVGDDVGRDYQTLVDAVAGTAHALRIRSGRKLSIPADTDARIEMIPRLTYLELRDLYAGASVVVVPLHDMDHASGITAIFEGMAMGLPVIASNIATSRDYLIHGETGWLVPPGDPAALRQAIEELSGNAQLRERLGGQARLAIEDKYSATAFARRFSERLRDVAETVR